MTYEDIFNLIINCGGLEELGFYGVPELTQDIYKAIICNDYLHNLRLLTVYGCGHVKSNVFQKIHAYT